MASQRVLWRGGGAGGFSALVCCLLRIIMLLHLLTSLLIVDLSLLSISQDPAQYFPSAYNITLNDEVLNDRLRSLGCCTNNCG
jgi:hypothetical protein